jgi:hypothetical protein
VIILIRRNISQLDLLENDVIREPQFRSAHAQPFLRLSPDPDNSKFVVILNEPGTAIIDPKCTNSRKCLADDAFRLGVTAVCARVHVYWHWHALALLRFLLLIPRLFHVWGSARAMSARHAQALGAGQITEFRTICNVQRPECLMIIIRR